MIFDENPFGRKERNSNNKQNKIRTQLLLCISKEVQNNLNAKRVLINSKSPQNILAEFEEYEIVINTPVIIGNKREDSIGSSKQKSSPDKRTSSISSSFMPDNQRKLKCPFAKYSSHNNISHIQETKMLSTCDTIKQYDDHEGREGDADQISYDQDLQRLKMNLSHKEKKIKQFMNGMQMLKQIVTDRIIKPLPKVRIMRHAKKHETMEFNDKRVMKRIEQITFSEETSFYNDTDGIYAIDLTVYEGMNKLSADALKHFKRNERQRSHTEQMIDFPQRNFGLASLK